MNIRLETTADYYAVEEMTREAFWRFREDDRVICDEHLLVYQLYDGALVAIRAQGFPTLDILKSQSEREIASLPGMSAEAVETVRALMQERGFRWGRG